MCHESGDDDDNQGNQKNRVIGVCVVTDFLNEESAGNSDNNTEKKDVTEHLIRELQELPERFGVNEVKVKHMHDFNGKH